MVNNLSPSCPVPKSRPGTNVGRGGGTLTGEIWKILLEFKFHESLYSLVWAKRSSALKKCSFHTFREESAEGKKQRAERLKGTKTAFIILSRSLARLSSLDRDKGRGQYI